MNEHLILKKVFISQETTTGKITLPGRIVAVSERDDYVLVEFEFFGRKHNLWVNKETGNNGVSISFPEVKVIYG